MTVSRSGQRVAAIRRRMSSTASCGKSIWKGRIVPSSVACPSWQRQSWACSLGRALVSPPPSRRGRFDLPPYVAGVDARSGVLCPMAESAVRAYGGTRKQAHGDQPLQPAAFDTHRDTEAEVRNDGGRVPVADATVGVTERVPFSGHPAAQNAQWWRAANSVSTAAAASRATSTCPASLKDGHGTCARSTGRRWLRSSPTPLACWRRVPAGRR